MGMVRKSFTLTEQQDAWLKMQMATGHYGNESEIIRDLIRDRAEQYIEGPAEIAAIRAAIQEGLDSGPAETYTREELLAEFKARYEREKGL